MGINNKSKKIIIEEQIKNRDKRLIKIYCTNCGWNATNFLIVLLAVLSLIFFSVSISFSKFFTWDILLSFTFNISISVFKSLFSLMNFKL